jgi:hypothetical protein
MNAMTGIAFLGVWRAESMTGLLGGIAVGFTLLSVSHQFKKRGYRNAGRERLRVGPVLPVAPANSGMFALGILFFVICGLAMLVIPEFSQLTRIAMTVLCLGLAVSFAALANPACRRLVLTLFALAMVTSGVLFAVDATQTFSGGGENATLESIKTAILAAAVLFSGGAISAGLLQGKAYSPDTPLYDNGMHSQWGFLPWSMLELHLKELDGASQLHATMHNGWSLTMTVPREQLCALETLLDELATRTPDDDAAPQPV